MNGPPRTTPIPPALLEKMRSVSGKRPRALLDLLEKQESVSTEQLESLGYTHPPRVAGDVKEHGIPIVRIPARDSNGRAIGAYMLGDPDEIRANMGGRKAFTKEFRETMLAHYGARSTLSGAPYPARVLQIDHRIPFQIGGDPDDDDVRHYMLLDASQQRAKSFSCETCPNLLGEKSVEVCRRCFWASPEDYDHIATEERRRAEVEWVAGEVASYERLKAAAKAAGLSVPAFIKSRLG